MAKSYGWMVTQWLSSFVYKDGQDYRRKLIYLPDFLYAEYGLEGRVTEVSPHIQLFIVFDKKVGMATMRKHFPKSNVSNLRTSFEQCSRYVRKEGKYYIITKNLLDSAWYDLRLRKKLESGKPNELPDTRTVEDYRKEAQLRILEDQIGGKTSVQRSKR